jgi:catechol 2,3-dioxygenase-like lactoylglutathione lyase family enzyme
MRILIALILLTSASAQDLPLTGISHVAFRVSDLDKARAFYTGVLGFPEAFTLNTIHFMKVNDDQFISIVTTDVEKLHQMLIDRGLHPTDLKPPGGDGTRAIRLPDLDGNPIEFTQYLPGSLHAQARGKFLDAARISTHLQHAGYPVKDLPAAIAFYRDKLGFVQVFKGDPAKGELPLANMRMPGPRGDYIELIPGNAQHACLEVPDIPAAYKIATDRGAEGKPPSIGRTLRWLFNIYDPDRDRIEFIESKLAK